MNKLPLFLLLLLPFITLAQKNQPDTIPAAVKTGFEKEYPDTRIKSWELKENKYIANTKIDGQNALAFFSPSGTWIETVYVINEKELPGKISAYLDNTYPSCDIKLAQYKENKSNGAFYFLKIQKARSTQDIDAELFFDVSGNFQTRNEFHPLTEALSSSTKQEAERNAKLEKEKAEYEAHRAALLKMDRSVAESDLPARLGDQFKKKFPKAEGVKWDSLDNIYTAHFIDKENPVTADFAPDGDWQSTTETLPAGPVFRPVDTWLEQNYPSYQVKLAQQITRRDRNNGYYLEVHEKSKKGSSPPVTKLYFDKSGRIEKVEEPPKVVVASSDGEKTEVKAPEPDLFEAQLKKEDKGRKAMDDITALKVTPRELPSSILNYIETTYPEHKVKESYFSDYEDLGSAYKVIIRREGINQASSDLYFNYKGKLLREDNPPPKKVVEEEVVEKKAEPVKTEKEVIKEQAYAVNESDIPEIVTRNFSRRYPRAVDAFWKEGDDSTYLVEFYHNDVKNILAFTPDGVIQLTRTEMDPKTLFGPVQRYLGDHYPDFKVRYAEKIVRKDRNNYFYVEVYNRKRNASPAELQLYFDKVGRPMDNSPE